MKKGLSCSGRLQGGPSCVTKAVREFFASLLKDREEGAVESVIVGFSGGVDSTVLLHALYELGSDLGLQPVAAHLNHRLRGADSDADEAFCRAFCERLGIPFRSMAIDVSELASKTGLNLEDAGRRARYTLYSEVAEEFGAKYAALAHHADDQAETVLMRIIRGAGTRGMGAMPRIRKSGRIYIVRPLISVRKSDVEAYAEENGIEFREDTSNLDTGYLRNKIRHELLPLLEAGYSEGIVDVLCRTAELAREESAALDELGRKAFLDALIIGQRGRSVSLKLDAMKDLSEAARSRALRMAYQYVRGTASDLYASNIAALAGLASPGGRMKRLDLPGGIKALKVGRELSLSCSSSQEAEERLHPSALTVPGMVDTPLMRIRAASCEIPRELLGKRRYSHQELAQLADLAFGHGYAEGSGAGSAFAVFDLREAGEPSIRAWEPGDSMMPFGMKGRRKLQDVFTDAKVPKDQRKIWPVVTLAGGAIGWVPGLRQGAVAKLGSDSRSALVLAFERKGHESKPVA